MTVSDAAIKDVLRAVFRTHFSKKTGPRAWIFRYASLLIHADNAFTCHNNGMIVKVVHLLDRFCLEDIQVNVV